MNLENCAELFESFRRGILFVGFSGGADSTAALLVAAKSGCRTVAVHFDHGLRGEESRREAEEARSFAAARDIEFRLFRLELAPGPNLEAAARVARLAVWKELAAGRPDAAVVLGHHADDRAETLLLRLLRGSNASGLTALRETSRVEGVTFLRPLLRVRRGEIETYLRDVHGIRNWAEDSSNADESLTRNALRRRILPDLSRLTPGSGAGIFHSLDAVEDDARFLEAEAERRYREATAEERASFAFWTIQPPAMRVRLLRQFVAEASKRDFIPNRALLERFDSLLAAPSPEARLLQLDAERTLLFRNETLELKQEATPHGPAVWNWQTTPEFVWNGFRFRAEPIASPVPGTDDSALFDADALPAELVADRRRNGDRIVPFGESAPRSLKKLRTDRGLPTEDPRPVLRGRNGDLFWAPGIRHSNLARITAATERIVRLTLSAAKPDFS